MSILDSIILGLVQGLTEFLPVSSSGHLVLGQELLSINVQGIAFEVFVHFGTLLSVVTVYRGDILALLRSLVVALREPHRLGSHYRDNRDFRCVLFIIAASVPAGVIGIAFGASIEQTFNDARMVAWMLVVTGTILLLTRVIRTERREMGLGTALLIGVAQACAIMPGISRSGSTIATALFLGIDREEAARFSFLMAVPVILGATILKSVELAADLPSTPELMGLAAGTITAFITGYVAIRLLLAFIRRGKLDYFAWYCYVVGGAALILL